MEATSEPLPTAEKSDLHQALLRHFGYDRFRAGQEQVIRSVLSGRPTVAILPTGGGKSLCYQLPALLLPGTTVVASPLVALMKDQVDALQARGIAATFINSSLSPAEQQERQQRLRRGEWRLCYVAPERFRSPSFLAAVRPLRVPLLAVDEAHCISAWGHDFRPDYARLAQARGELQAERLLALTATATPEVRRDISAALGLADPRVFVAGFDRPNLFIEAVHVAGDRDKLSRIAQLVRAGPPGIVYAGTRRNVEKVVASLRGRGLEAIGYHAGMDDAERTAVQEQFIRGGCEVIVATNAFGMGVDKGDIRFVAHFDVPRSVEGWYQEIGRAGRDGKPSLAVLLFNFADVMMQRRLIDNGRASEELVRATWEAALRLRRGSLDELARATGRPVQELQAAVRILESAGHFDRQRRAFGEFQLAGDAGPGDALAIDFALLERRVQRERQMLDRMVRLADTKGCRRRNLLAYFGDEGAPQSCEACDNCVGARTTAGPVEPEPERPRRRDRSARLEEAADRLLRSDGRSGRGTSGASPAGQAVDEVPVDPELFAALRALRTELAREGQVPPYVVFHDSTLKALCQALPENEREFLAVKGAGPARWERYGARVVALTRAAADRRRQAGGVPAPVGQRPSPAQATPPPVRKGPLTPPPLLARERGLGSQEMPPWLEAPPPAGEGPAASHREGPGDAGLVAAARAGEALVALATRHGLPVAEAAGLLCAAHQAGERFDGARLLGPERFAAMVAAAEGSDGDLVAVRRRLPFAAALAEVRLALLSAGRG